MLCNVATWDRLFRFTLGFMTLTYAIAGGPAWFYGLGFYSLATAAWGLCPIYSFFRIRTLR